MAIQCDICIIGGGPAGSVLASRLAAWGWNVIVVERAAFPRRHLGESLSPGVLPLLETIGAADAIESAGFTRVRRVSVDWDVATERDDPAGRGLLVDRGRFDRLLLDHARGRGARVLQPARAGRRRWTGSAWEVEVTVGTRPMTLQATFLADASGRGGITGSRRPTGARTVALHGYWEGKGLPSHPKIEAGPNRWHWGVPLPDGSYNTLVFLDPADLKVMSGTLGEKFHTLLAGSGLIPRGAEAFLSGPVRACDATPYLDEACVSDAFIRVGDAALALDPLSSSGVQKAIQSALSGSVVVNTLLRRPESAELARQYFLHSLSEASARHQEWAGAYYGLVASRRADPFWQKRATGVASGPLSPEMGEGIAGLTPETRLRLSPDVSIRQVPCVGDSFIEARPAVCSTALGTPVAYLGGVELVPLICGVRDGMTVRELVTNWSRDMAPARGMESLRWMVSRGLLIAGAARQAAGKGGGS